MVALDDIGFWARHIFDDPSTTTGQDLEIASEMVSYPHIVDTFTRVTGQKAEYKRLTLEEYFDLFDPITADGPVASGVTGGTTYRQNFTATWAMWRDEVCKRDMEKVLAVHPESMTLDRWIGETGFDGSLNMSLMKNVEDATTKLVLNMDKIQAL